MTDDDVTARRIAAMARVRYCPRVPAGVVYIDNRPAGTPCLWCDVVHLSLDDLLTELGAG